MKYKIFTVFDNKSKLYSQPAFMKTQGEAMRSFMEACKDEKATIGKYPEDFLFCHLGEFDEETGVFETHEPNSIARGIDYKE